MLGRFIRFGNGGGVDKAAAGLAGSGDHLCGLIARDSAVMLIRLCLKTQVAGFERVFRTLAASGWIDKSRGFACFAVLVRPRNPALSGLRQRLQTEPS